LDRRGNWAAFRKGFFKIRRVKLFSKFVPAINNAIEELKTLPLSN